MYKKVIFVCTGNTCRSPMAQYLLQNELEKKHSNEKLSILSRGLAVYGEQRANANAVTVMKEDYEIDIDRHNAKLLTREDLDADTLILTMTHRHKVMLAKFYKDTQVSTYTLKEWLDIKGDVGDPYGQDLECYRACAQELFELVKMLYETLS